MHAFAGQLRTELRLGSRQGEQLLVSIGIPLLVLVFFSLVDVLPTGTDDPVDYLAPAVLSLAVISTSMVSLGIGTGFERQYGVLKRLGASPLGTPRWVLAKLAFVTITQTAQWIVLIGVSLLIGWNPPASGWVVAVAAALVGTAAFGGIGLLMAGSLPGVLTLALANGVYIVFLLIGGIIVPLNDLPGPMEALSRLFPAAAMTDIITESLSTGGVVSAWSWPVLLVWGLATPLAAGLLFRWDAPD
jgi:ABC-2 type transport system permease protein